MTPKGRTMLHNELPNWYGIDGIGFEFRGAWNDPLLHYKGRKFNGNDVQDGLWELYVEDTGNIVDNEEWVQYVVDNAVNYLEDVILVSESE